MSTAMSILFAAADEQSWNMLSVEYPDFLEGIEFALEKGESPDTIYMRFVAEYGRDGIAKRIQQAARHVLRLQADE